MYQYTHSLHFFSVDAQRAATTAHTHLVICDAAYDDDERGRSRRIGTSSYAYNFSDVISSSPIVDVDPDGVRHAPQQAEHKRI